MTPENQIMLRAVAVEVDRASYIQDDDLWYVDAHVRPLSSGIVHSDANFRLRLPTPDCGCDVPCTCNSTRQFDDVMILCTPLKSDAVRTAFDLGLTMMALRGMLTDDAFVSGHEEPKDDQPA